MATIGFIGLGAMGLPMARRLCRAGHSLTVAVHRNPAPAEVIRQLGGTMAPSVPEAVADAEVVISILPGDKELLDLYGSQEVVRALPPGCLVIDMTTASPDTAKSIGASLENGLDKGIRFLDAPVSGGIKGAEDGALTIMCGGDELTYQEALPILRTLGKSIPLVGRIGDGKALKAVNQLLVSVNTVAVAEALFLARELGLDLDVVRDVVSNSSGNSAAFQNKFASMVKGDYTPRFTSVLMRKDLDIALRAAPPDTLDLAIAARRIYGRLGAEFDDQDYSVIAEWYGRSRSGGRPF